MFDQVAELTSALADKQSQLTALITQLDDVTDQLSAATLANANLEQRLQHAESALHAAATSSPSRRPSTADVSMQLTELSKLLEQEKQALAESQEQAAAREAELQDLIGELEDQHLEAETKLEEAGAQLRARELKLRGELSAAIARMHEAETEAATAKQVRSGGGSSCCTVLDVKTIHLASGIWHLCTWHMATARFACSLLTSHLAAGARDVALCYWWHCYCCRWQ